MSPVDVLRSQGVPSAVIANSRPTQSPTGDKWTATTRYIDPKGSMSLAHLAASGWSINIDIRNGGQGLLITMQESPVNT